MRIFAYIAKLDTGYRSSVCESMATFSELDPHNKYLKSTIPNVESGDFENGVAKIKNKREANQG